MTVRTIGDLFDQWPLVDEYLFGESTPELVAVLTWLEWDVDSMMAHRHYAQDFVNIIGEPTNGQASEAHV